MNSRYIKSLLALTIVFGTVHAMERQRAQTSQPPVIFPSQVIPKTKLVIADLGGISTISGTSAGIWALMKYLWKLNPVAITAYSLMGNNPGKLQHVIFRELNQVQMHGEQGFIHTKTDKGIDLPYLICAYQAGRITSVEAKRLALESLQARKSAGIIHGWEAMLVENAFNLMFVPETQAAFIWPLAKGVALMQKLAAVVDIDLVGLTNWDKESIVLFKPHCPELFSCFAKLYVSGEMGTVKPNASSFTQVMQERGFAAGNVILLDDQLENCEAARALGIDAIHVTSIEQAEVELAKRGINL